MREEFERTKILIGEEGVEKLSKARVIIFGVGGVGGYVAEALARSGVGELDLVDKDVVSVSNINRQVIALGSTVGKSKVLAFKERILDINPDCRVNTHEVFYLPDNKGDFDFCKYDYVVDAIDTVAGKMQIIEEAKSCGVKVISAMGAGNKLDGGKFRIADIYDTKVCPLAKVIRSECRKRGIKSLKCVYSEEIPRTGLVVEGERKAIPGSIAFVPSVAGLLIAGEVVRDIIEA